MSVNGASFVRMVRKACQVVLIILATHAKGGRRRQRGNGRPEGEGHAEQRCLYLQMNWGVDLIRCVEYYESTLKESSSGNQPACVASR